MGRDATGRMLRRRARSVALLAVVLTWLPIAAQSQTRAFTASPAGANIGAQAAGKQRQAPIELQGDEPLAEYLILRFMQGHPDLFWRVRGRSFYALGEYERARECFERGARFADKPSQAMLGEMHWQGLGGPRDRALGYAWMDLAAERLYEDFYILRERYWAQLDAGQREQALRRGQKLLREYGDEKAKPRLAKVLVRQRPIGIDVGGFFGNLPIIPPSGAGRDSITLRGSEYFDDTFWEPEAYFAWQDTIWKTLHSTGRVEVGEPGAVGPETAD
jgi:tetratricopeptide (TPR) repeat protein